MNLQVENVSMSYEDEELVLVKVEYYIRGDVIRSARGIMNLSAEEYAGNESVSVLKEMVREAVITELEDEGDDEED